MKTSISIGVDTGGTFTDLVLVKESAIQIHKLLSTPADPAKAVVSGLRELLEKSSTSPDASCAHIIHGSTVAANAVLERKGVRTALVTTAGFEDVLAIGRQTRNKLYDLQVTKPNPLTPRELCFGVSERSLSDGGVLKEVDRAELEKTAAALAAQGVESIAVCFLFSYTNPTNEQKAVDVLGSLGVHISASHEILREYREYERFSTTVINAYISPIMDTYLSSLESSIGVGKSLSLRIMRSNGGSISVDQAKRKAAHTILSGPAGGVVGARKIASLAGIDNIITFDMGGTSTDVSLLGGFKRSGKEKGAIHLSTEWEIDGLPLKTPVIDIHTVGAGGGSIARIDEGGALRVGPESAGADPGPICYGQGDEVTVTDANLYLGRLICDFFLGGQMQLDEGRLEDCFSRLASRLGISNLELASGVIEIANATMERAIRLISIERGYDPRDFTLVTFGGAGGLHACELATRLSIPQVLIPKNPGLLSAFGMLFSDLVKDYSQTVLRKLKHLSLDELNRLFAPLIEKAHHDMLQEGFKPQEVALRKSLDLRYEGQSYELNIPFSEAVSEDFDEIHERRFGYCHRGRDVELVNLRLQATCETEKPLLRAKKLHGTDPKAARFGERTVLFRGDDLETPVYHRDKLLPGNHIEGPALVVEFSSTTFTPPQFNCCVDCHENLIIRR